MSNEYQPFFALEFMLVFASVALLFHGCITQDQVRKVSKDINGIAEYLPAATPTAIPTPTALPTPTPMPTPTLGEVKAMRDVSVIVIANKFNVPCVKDDPRGYFIDLRAKPELFNEVMTAWEKQTGSRRSLPALITTDTGGFYSE